MAVIEVNERPIIFAPWEVRAAREGRKTQARRVVNMRKPRKLLRCVETTDKHEVLRCYPRPWDVGDRVWVRETWWWHPIVGSRRLREGADTWPTVNGEFVAYDADGEDEQWIALGWIKRSSVHMPRWASRLEYDVTAVRVERLQDISEADAFEEGCTGDGYTLTDDSFALARQEFAELWDATHGRKPGRAWADNCWVWVLGLEVADKPDAGEGE